MHTYSVELRIVGDDLEESEVSSVLGLRPTLFHKKGEQKSPTLQMNQSVWSFEVCSSPGNPEWKSVEEGLASLLGTLLPLKDFLDELKQRYSVMICCGHFASGFGGGPSLSPEILRSLAALEVKLSISTYWSEEVSTGRENSEPE